MIIAELLKWAVKKVDVACEPSPHLSVEILLAYTLNQSRSFLHTHPQQIVSDSQEQQFKSYLARFLQGEPIAYVTGKREFWSLELKVTPDTLIPRQETELLVEFALKLLVNSPECLIADLGTGSGAVALAIAHERPAFQIIATDKSPAALSIAKHNAKNLNIQNIIFKEGSWCEALVGQDKFDLIISNPPYLDEEELHQAARGLLYEPYLALVANEKGLSEICRIVYEAWNYLKKGGYLCIEHGQTQGEKVRSIFLEVGYNDIKTEYDLAGLERITWGRRG